MSNKKQETDLVLVNPGAGAKAWGKLGSTLAGIEPPLWCALIAAFVRKSGVSVKIIDAEAENLSPESTAEKIAEYNPIVADIVVLGINPSASSTPKMTAAGEVTRELKKKAPHIKTIFSGLHPSALPEQTLKEEVTDFVCHGEGFHTILQLVKALKSNGKTEAVEGLWYIDKGTVKNNPTAPLVNPDDLPMAAWDLLPMDKYRAHNWHCFAHIDQRQPYGVIYTSFGCPFNCTYCNVRALYNDAPGIRFYSPEKVIEQIDYLVKNYKIKNIKFLDELFAINEARVMRICDLIIERGYDLNIWAYARVDTVNERMLNKMKQAGINWLCYGFESANETVRKGVAKKTGQDTTKKAVEMTKAAGIYIIANFMFGLPDDNQETMRQTLDMAKSFNFEYINFYAAMAYPGSQLYLDTIKEGTALPEQWYGYSQYAYETIPLPTKYISAAEVLRFRDQAFKEYFSNPKYLQMIEEKFGPKVVEHVKGMLKNDIKRKLLENNDQV